MINTPSPPSLSSLSPFLLKRYSSYGGVDRRTFKSLFMALWSYLWPVSRLDPVSHCYLLAVVLGRADPLITLGQFFYLSRLWLLTGGGVLAVDSRTLNLSKVEINAIPHLMRAGLLIRTSFDPYYPGRITRSAGQKVFISFTPAGSSFYVGVVKMLNRMVRDDIMSVQVGNK